MSMNKPVLFLSGPYGFSQISARGMALLIEILSKHFRVVNPFEDDFNARAGEEIARLGESLLGLSHDKGPSENGEISYNAIPPRLQDLSMAIAGRNEQLLRESSIVLAILDGPDVDSGTASEIGLAYALGKPIFGYRSDFRMAGDNPGTVVNLQVEYFIRKSGGSIIRTPDELASTIPKMLELISKTSGGKE